MESRVVAVSIAAAGIVAAGREMRTSAEVAYAPTRVSASGKAPAVSAAATPTDMTAATPTPAVTAATAVLSECRSRPHQDGPQNTDRQKKAPALGNHVSPSVAGRAIATFLNP